MKPFWIFGAVATITTLAVCSKIGNHPQPQKPEPRSLSRAVGTDLAGGVKNLNSALPGEMKAWLAIDAAYRQGRIDFFTLVEKKAQRMLKQISYAEFQARYPVIAAFLTAPGKPRKRALGLLKTAFDQQMFMEEIFHLEMDYAGFYLKDPQALKRYENERKLEFFNWLQNEDIFSAESGGSGVLPVPTGGGGPSPLTAQGRGASINEAGPAQQEDPPIIVPSTGNMPGVNTVGPVVSSGGLISGPSGPAAGSGGNAALPNLQQNHIDENPYYAAANALGA